MQQPQFGRRGVTLNGEGLSSSGPAPAWHSGAANAAPAEPSSLPGLASVEEYLDPAKPGRKLLIGVGIVLALLMLDTMLASTELITPINGTLLYVMRAIGGVLGLAAGIALYSKIQERDGSFRAVAAVLAAPLFGLVAFDALAWRMADWASFGFSSQAFEPAKYPIESISRGRKGREDTIQIDPFNTGESAEIPITRQQYQALSGTSANQCVTVMQRKAPNGAIEIKTNGSYTMTTPVTVEVTPCIIDADGTAKEAPQTRINPWSKT